MASQPRSSAAGVDRPGEAPRSSAVGVGRPGARLARDRRREAAPPPSDPVDARGGVRAARHRRRANVRRRRYIVAGVMAFAGLLAALGLGRQLFFAGDDAPLHARIDALVAANASGPLAEIASDGEFLRRVYLDLAGRPPSVEEAKAFLADPAADMTSRGRS